MDDDPSHSPPATATSPFTLRTITLSIILFECLYAAFLIARPLPAGATLTVADVALILGLTAGVLLCFLDPRRPGHLVSGAVSGRRLGLNSGHVPLLLGLGVFMGLITAAWFDFYDLVLHRVLPPSSPADLIFVSAHPFALLAIMLLPARPLLWTSRARLTLDGLLVLAASITFAWFYLLGPIMVGAQGTTLDKISQSAYPLTDLIVIVSLLVLSSQFGNVQLRATALSLTAAFVLLVITDCVFDYQRLHGLYHAGSLLHAGWTSTGLLIGLAAFALRTAMVEHAAEWEQREAPPQLPESQRLHFWRSIIPYFLMLAVGALVVHTISTETQPAVATGVYIGAGVIVVLALARQLLAIVESSRLYGRLNESYDSLREHVAATDRLNDELAAANAQLEEMAAHDPLTGLPNRVLYRDRLQHGIAATRRSEETLAVLLIDLDRFKEVNDAFGHGVGDILLQQVSTRLESALRQVDTIARLGGDEFAVLLPATDESGVRQVVTKLFGVFARPVVVDGHILHCEGSIGIALCPEHGEDDETLLRHADVAMYDAKRSGTGYAFYDSDRDTSSPARVTMTAELRAAIEGDELMLYYQPKIDLRTGLVCSVEALVRWRHPLRGLIPPGDFIPLAEHTGLFRPLTEWVLWRARREALKWRALGHDIPIAVNVSARSLRDDSFLQCLQDLRGDEPSLDWLIIEITESTLMTDPTRSMNVLHALAEFGVQIAIDDFGTGYSSLSYLTRLLAHELKIDRGFVTDMLANPDDTIIVRSVIDLGHNLGMRVVAEGVEDRATEQLLMTSGCDQVQGYLHGRPTPPDEMLKKLEESQKLLAG